MDIRINNGRNIIIKSIIRTERYMHTFTSKHGWGKIIPDFYEIKNNV